MFQQAFTCSNSPTETTAMCEVCSKLTKKTPERRHCRRSGVFIVNFERISHIVLVFPLLILNKEMPVGNNHQDY